MKTFLKSVFGIILFLIFFNLSFAAGITNPRLLGADCTQERPTDFEDASEIKLTYAVQENAPYAGPRNPSSIRTIVWHDPGSNDCSPWPHVSYGHGPGSHEGCYGRQCGYTFYIGMDGLIVQGAPMNKRTIHFMPNNSTTIGLSLVCAGGRTNLPPEQVKNSILLSEAVRTAYNFNGMLPHGVAPNRANREGYAINGLARNDRINQNGKFLIHYNFGRGQELYCKISGTIPPCTENCDNSPLPSVAIPRSYGPDTNFSSPYVGPDGKFGGDSADWGYPLMKTQPFNPPPTPTTQDPNKKPGMGIVGDEKIGGALGNLKGNTDACSEAFLTEKKLRVKYYYSNYDSKFKSKYGDWEKLLSKGDTKFDLNLFLAIFYAKQIKSNLLEIQKCVKL